MVPRTRDLLVPAAIGIVGLGILLRAWLLVERPLWLDEVFTLWVARHAFGELPGLLRHDTGPPLHYLLVQMSIAAGGDIVPDRVLVRIPAFVASLLQLPLLWSLGRRCGGDGVALRALVLGALSPLGIRFAAEGRGYALAGFWVLLALELTLRLREQATTARAAALAATCAAAVLTMYATALPLALLPLLLVRAPASARLRFAAASLSAVLVVAPWWGLVARHQPLGGQAWPWRALVAPGDALARTLNGLAFGVDDAGRVGAVVAAALLVAAGAWRRETLAPLLAAAPLVVLAVATVQGNLALLPARGLMVVAPLAHVLLAVLPWPAVALTVAAGLAGLGGTIRPTLQPNPHEELAAWLGPKLAPDDRVVVAGLPAVEVDYFLARLGRPGRVRFFPRDVQEHPGWHDDREPPTPALRDEARGAAEEGTVFVLPHGARASLALGERLRDAPRAWSARTPTLEIVGLARR